MKWWYENASNLKQHEKCVILINVMILEVSEGRNSLTLFNGMKSTFLVDMKEAIKFEYCCGNRNRLSNSNFGGAKF